MKYLHQSYLRLLTATAAVFVIGSFASGADKIYHPFKQFTITKIKTATTTTVSPQIQPMHQATHETSENEFNPPINLDVPNNLVPGGANGFSRGTPKITFGGPGFTGYFPPDCDMGVGPNYVISVVNTRMAFFAKASGTKVFEQDMDNNGFFSGVGGASEVYSDPKVFFDKVSGRWFVFIIEVNGLGSGTHKSRVLMAVSDDDNPNGNWFKYSIDVLVTSGGSDYWLDYPTVGVNKDAIAIGGNNFGFSGGFVGTLFVIKKASLLTGGAAQVTAFQDPSSFTIQPARSSDSTSDKLYCMSAGSGSTAKVYVVNTAPATPTLQSTNVTVPSYQSSTDAVSAGGNALDTLGSRMFNCVYRGGKLLAAHTVRPTGGGPNRVRWYQVNVNSWPTSGQPTLGQSGEVVGASGADTHMPAIAINAFNDISITYSLSSSTIAADLMRVSRIESDAPGTMGVPVKIKGSSGTYQFGRWGDYFSTAVDPSDDSTFWGFGMNITNSGTWDTTVASWTVSNGSGGSGVTVDADSISTVYGNLIGGDLTSITLSDDVNYQIASVPSSGLGQVAGAEATFTVPANPAAASVKVESTAGVPGATLMLYGYKWSTNSYVLITSKPAPATGNTAIFMPIPTTSLSSYLDGTNHAKFMVRAHIPLRPFSSTYPSPFTFKIDVLQMNVTPGS